MKRYQRGATPYHLTYRNDGWRIGYGVSSFLVAEGSGWSRPLAMKVKKVMDDEYARRSKPKRRKSA